MKDTLRDDCDDSTDCVKNCCVSTIIAPIFFVIFVLMAQFVLVNVVVAVLMKHLEESHKHLEDELDMEMQLERELAAEQQELLDRAEAEEEENERQELAAELGLDVGDEDLLEKLRLNGLDRLRKYDDLADKRIREFHGEYLKERLRPGLSKVRSLPSNFTYNPPAERHNTDDSSSSTARRSSRRRRSSSYRGVRQSRMNMKRRQTFHSQQRGPLLHVTHLEVPEIPRPLNNLSIPLIIPQTSHSPSIYRRYLHPDESDGERMHLGIRDKEMLRVTLEETPQTADTSLSVPPKSTNYLLTVVDRPDILHLGAKSRRPDVTKEPPLGRLEPPDDLDVHSVINERRPSKYNITSDITKPYMDNEQFSSSQGTNIDELYVTTSDRADKLNDYSPGTRDLDITHVNKVICTPVRDLEAEVNIYVDEDVDDCSSGSSGEHGKSISIIVDPSAYLETSTGVVDESSQIDDVINEIRKTFDA